MFEKIVIRKDSKMADLTISYNRQKVVESDDPPPTEGTQRMKEAGYTYILIRF